MVSAVDVASTDRAQAAERGLAGRWALPAILAAAALIRLYWAHRDIHVVSGDECEYLRLAQNLVKSRAYVGLFEGPQIMYPPLFSILIALFSIVTRSFETAGGLVSLIAGVSLVAGVFWMAREMYGTRVGLIASFAAAFHPALIELSDAVYSESIALPLVIVGVTSGLVYLNARERRFGVVCGLCFGLAYLTRPEALAFPALIAAAGVLKARMTRGSLRLAVARGLLIVTVAGAVAIPYVVYLSRQTGRLQLEGKSAMNFAIGRRLDAGMSYAEATFGLGPGSREDGPFLSPNLWVMRAPPKAPLAQLIRYWPSAAHRNWERLEDYVLFLVFGAIGIAFVALGLFGQPWDESRFFREIVVLAVVNGYGIILAGQHQIAYRYVLPFLPFFLVWAAHGVEHAMRWYRVTSGTLTRRASRLTQKLVAQFGYVVLFGILLIGLHRLTWAEDFHSRAPGEADLRDAGLWIKANAHAAARVMSNSNEVPYYAGGVALRLPFADSGAALAYIHAKRPDYIVLSRGPSIAGAYGIDWFEHGIPDPAARLVGEIGPEKQPHALIYAWDQAK